MLPALQAALFPGTTGLTCTALQCMLVLLFGCCRGRELDCELKQFRLAGDALMESGAALELRWVCSYLLLLARRVTLMGA